MIKYVITKANDWNYKEFGTVSPNDFYKMIKILQDECDYELIVNFDTYLEADVEIMIHNDYIE